MHFLDISKGKCHSFTKRKRGITKELLSGSGRSGEHGIYPGILCDAITGE